MNKKSIESLDIEIEEIRTKLTDECPPTSMEAFKKEVDEQYLIWEKEVQEIKLKKFQRDVKDFQTNRVYRWNYSQNRNPQRSRTASITSVSSLESGSGSTFYDTQSSLRNRKRKGEVANREQSEKKRAPKAKGTSKLQVINLSQKHLTKAQEEVLGMGQTFSPTARFNSFSVLKDYIYLHENWFFTTLQTPIQFGPHKKIKKMSPLKPMSHCRHFCSSGI